ncbi:MAG: alpha/beta fold hydrolase [Anaerolineae bacterium]|nr:alpha/beta fold hydrolase [Anaerolineae bacterium]
MSASLAVAAPEVQPPNTFQATPCMFKGLELGIVTISPEEMGFECGYISVPEQHANPDGPTIRLPVAIRRATSTNPKPDPLFLAQGGPGGSAFEIFPITVPNTSIAAERDIVIFNQRGTVYAQPELVCTELRDAMPNLLALPPDEGEQKWQELLGECYQRLRAAGINLSAYNSLENAADVEVIRQTLGYDEFNFYGVSYGTLLGLHLIREYPQHLRSVILDSVVPTNLNFITQVPTSENRIYDELFQFCAERPSCAASYPDLEARFWAIVDQLNNSPTTLRLTHPDTGEQVTAYLDGDILLETVYQALYLSDSYAVFPKIVANLENNDYTFIQNIWAFIAFDRTFSEGMYYSVICAEDANFDPIIVGLDGLRSQIAARVPDDMQSYQDSCAVWPVDLLPSKVDEPVVSNIPTLLLSGRFDPITPPVFAATAAASLANAYNVVDPLTSHGVAFNHDCINQVVQDFLNNPTTEPDATCLTTQIPITVVPPNAITLPLLARVAELDRPFLTETAIGGLLLAGVLSAFVIWPIILVVNIILGKKLTFTTRQKWLHWSSRLLILVFGLLAVIFVAGLVGFVMYVLFSESSYLSAFTIPGTARPILLIPPLLLLLTISIVGIAGFIWHQKNWPRWDKVYYTFLAICALGYVIMLSIHGLLFV